MNIKNYDDLFLSPNLSNKSRILRKIGFEALESAIESVRPQKLIEKSIKIERIKLTIIKNNFELSKYNNIYIIGGGKAVAAMANSIIELLENASLTNYKGIINIQQGLNIKNLEYLNKIRLNFASHPIPDKNGLKGTKEMMELIKNAKENDLIICLISGGGSSLLTLPKKGITLQDIRVITLQLLECGASIQEINTIRKHVSEFKGGNLARGIHSSSKATLISLIISDVIGNSLDSIASGPTVPDSTTFNDAVCILKKYKIFEDIPLKIKKSLEEGLNKPELENPKEGDPCFKKVHNYLIGSIDEAVSEVKEYLKTQSFNTSIFSQEIAGEAKQFSKKLHDIIMNQLNQDENASKPKIALIGTGELTVTIQGKGKGGRNQELLLSLLQIMQNQEIDFHFLIIAANLDGIDGNSTAMGAFIDNDVLNRLKVKTLDTAKFLKDNDSNTFFKKLGTEIITGPTGCNVNDMIIVLLIK